MAAARTPSQCVLLSLCCRLRAHVVSDWDAEEALSGGDAAVRHEVLDTTKSFCVTARRARVDQLLTQRVLALLVTVERPEQVLAITFTVKQRQKCVSG